ncbi:MAG: YlmH/Sll1252 family protein [Oscillospiraceae bacterium]|nr:YlmH/Sll1252 family protein [Oscillospiraceae bacterium]
MEQDLIRRAEDLARRCVRTAEVTHTGFLTPAECALLEQWDARSADCQLLLHGGGAEPERRVAFFLPDWMDAETFDPNEYLCAVEVTARFGEPGHRDYLGAVLGLGIERAWIGDIVIDGGTAYIYCLPSVKAHLLQSLEKVGRYGVRTREAALSEVPAPQREWKETEFSVKSLRLDAVCAGAFGVSRTAAAEAIAAGLVARNYLPCLKPDAPIQEGDVLSLRGKGKAVVRSASGLSRKGRIFVRVGR